MLKFMSYREDFYAFHTTMNMSKQFDVMLSPQMRCTFYMLELQGLLESNSSLI